MIPLQAAIAAGFLLIGLFGAFLILGILFLTGPLMRLVWKISGNSKYSKIDKPYYKYPFLFIMCLCYAIIISVALFSLAMQLFFALNPDFLSVS